MISFPSLHHQVLVSLHALVAHVVQDGAHEVFVEKVAQHDEVVAVYLHREADTVCYEPWPVLMQVEELEERAHRDSEPPSQARKYQP